MSPYLYGGLTSPWTAYTFYIVPHLEHNKEVFYIELHKFFFWKESSFASVRTLGNDRQGSKPKGTCCNMKRYNFLLNLNEVSPSFLLDQKRSKKIKAVKSNLENYISYRGITQTRKRCKQCFVPQHWQLSSNMGSFSPLFNLFSTILFSRPETFLTL